MRFPETVTRRNLPHWYMPGAAHFVTYRLHGSLPQCALEELQSRKEALLRRKPAPDNAVVQYRQQVHKQLFALYDGWLDQAKDDALRDPRIAATIRLNLYHHNGTKYHLIAYCIMPNHVHVLFQPLDVATGGPPVDFKKMDTVVDLSTGEPPVATVPIGEHFDEQSPLTQVMHSLKSYTAHRANEILGRSGAFWQAESHDHWVRDDEELERIVDYVRANPVKAEFVARPEDWFWCSCHDRFVLDADTSGYLV